VSMEWITSLRKRSPPNVPLVDFMVIWDDRDEIDEEREPINQSVLRVKSHSHIFLLGYSPRYYYDPG